jgi:NAD(P)H-dependent flavin oxidoreductase YrpB (nitropropane dioxygenase family)
MSGPFKTYPYDHPELYALHSSAKMSVVTPATKLLGIQHPILLAGMGKVANPEMAAAVTNAGGLGVIGGIGYTPSQLREMIHELKGFLVDKNAPFGVDLLIPKVGGGARATNTDYTQGKLMELIDVIVEEKAKLFVCAVGVPPKAVVERLHKGGVLYGNMVGAPKHALKAIELGADIIIAQGGEAGGHTGEIPFSVLIPGTADVIRGHKSPLTGAPVQLIAGGGIFDGRSVAAALMLGANAVWVGTRFVAAKESGASTQMKEAVVKSGFTDFARTLIFSGRPVRIYKTPWIADWEENRQAEIRELTNKGILPMYHELEKLDKEGKLTEEIEDQAVAW